MKILLIFLSITLNVLSLERDNFKKVIQQSPLMESAGFEFLSKELSVSNSDKSLFEATSIFKNSISETNENTIIMGKVFFLYIEKDHITPLESLSPYIKDLDDEGKSYFFLYRWMLNGNYFDIINTIQTGYHAYILYYLRKHKDENAEELMRLINIDVYESYINDESYPLSFDLIACLNIDNKNNLSLKLFCETVSLSLKFKKIKFSDIPKVALDRLPNSKRKSLKVLCESTITLQNLSVDVKE